MKATFVGLILVLAFASFASGAGTSIMVIDGSVFYNDGATLVPDGWNVDVTNKTQGLRQSSTTGDAGPGRYSVTFIDILGGIVAQTGDDIEVVVTDADSNEHRVIYILTDEDIAASRTTIDVVIAVPATGSISGSVTDAATGGAIEKAFILAIQLPTKDKAWALTGKSGTYDISDLVPGFYLVIAIKKGYNPGVEIAIVKAGEVTTVDFMLTPK